jgi:ribose-phosphate pyrophosphokinase
MLLFSTQSYNYLKDIVLAHSLADRTSIEVGSIESKTFPDGEFYYRILHDVRHETVVLIGGTISDKDTLELYDLASGLVHYGAKRLVLVIPFFGYSTMERAVKMGEVVTAKTRALLLSAIPQAPYGNQVVLMDLHSEGIPHYFSTNLRTYHLYVKQIIMDIARKFGGNNFILASTDAGRAKWVESLANDMQVQAAFVYKRRTSGSETQVTGVNADVQGKNVVMYDDMIRTGGSLIQAARAYKEAGANKIYVIATHGLFPNQGLEKIRQSGLVEKIGVTDTHPNVLPLAGDFLEVFSIGGLLQKTLLSL